jgi:hypothetical protein
MKAGNTDTRRSSRTLWRAYVTTASLCRGWRWRGIRPRCCMRATSQPKWDLHTGARGSLLRRPLIEIEAFRKRRAIGTAIRSKWPIGCDFRRVLSGMARAHQFKKDSDYVSLIAGTKRKAGIGVYRHVSDLGFKFVLYDRASSLARVGRTPCSVHVVCQMSHLNEDLLPALSIKDLRAAPPRESWTVW